MTSISISTTPRALVDLVVALHALEPNEPLQAALDRRVVGRRHLRRASGRALLRRSELRQPLPCALRCAALAGRDGGGVLVALRGRPPSALAAPSSSSVVVFGVCAPIKRVSSS